VADGAPDAAMVAIRLCVCPHGIHAGAHPAGICMGSKYWSCKHQLLVPLLLLTDLLLCAAVLGAPQAQFTGQSMETITRDTDRDFFMSPQEAIEYGLVDAIISKPQVLPTRELATA
jgi:hypothetical protein